MSKTILDRMCSIYQKMRTGNEKNVMPMANIENARGDIRALSRILNLTNRQVVILTAIVQKSSRRCVDGESVSSMLGLEYLQFLTYNKEMDGLRKRGYIRIDQDGDIVIPKEVMNSLKNDQPVKPEPMEGLDAPDILARIRKVLSIREDNQCDTHEAADEIEEIIELNPDNSVSRFCLQYRRLHPFDRLILFVLIHKYYHDDDDKVSLGEIGDYFTEDELDRVKVGIRREDSVLQRDGVIEYTSDDGLVSKDYYHISDRAKEEIFADVGGIKTVEKKVSASRKVEAASIPRKELFYNPAEERQVAQLQTLMSEDRFNAIRGKMKEMNHRTGFTCLFYGAPGTGKTETVYQIARESGRNLFIVDVSQIKSCWVGESEKNIKGVFSKYRECVASGGTIPILLFNEADAIFGIRSEGAGSAVDKMENSIQNIILQEMEDLDGILIATTNLTSNLDKAFERRFLYKIRFEKPGIEARSRIWSLMIPDLSPEESFRLASDYDFSGGQIENVSRKRAIKSLISGENPSFAEIRGYCDEENIGDGVTARRRIGF